VLRSISKLAIVLFMIGLVTTAFAGIKAQKFKVSQHEDGYQIWFEAEDHTERLPDNDKFFPVVVKDGAFSQAITRTGKGGRCISCTVDDHKGDEIPNLKGKGPFNFPGQNRQRAFEQS